MQRDTMKLDEDLGPDREDDFQTDDEENQADRDFENSDDDDSESENNNSSPSPNLSNGVAISPQWPESYRQSMDMLTSISVTPPGISFLKRLGSAGRSSSHLSSPAKRSSKECQVDSLTIPLFSEQPTSTSNVQQSQLVSGTSIISSHGFPQSQQQCSFAQSVINGANILCGIGIVTIPYGVKEGGWLSLIILVLFAIMCCYTGILLMRCLQCHPGLKTYPDIGQAAFGMVGRLGISIVLYMELFGTCVEFLTLISDNLSSLFPNANLRLVGIDLGTHKLFAVTAALLVLPTVWLKNLSLLSYISVGGIFATTLVVFCLLWVGVIDQVGFNPKANFLDLSNISVSIGLFSFGFAGHSVFPNIYSSMKDQSKFPAVLILSFGFCLLMYLSVGVTGYLTFGDSIKSQFTLNMPKELHASKIATWTTVVTPLAKYALALLPIALCIEELVPSPKLRTYATSVLVRTVLVIICLVVTLSFPYFGSVMALIGSSMAMLVALIYPCACYLKLHSGRLTKIQITKCVLIIIVGVISGIAGTYSAMSRIISEGD